MLCNYSIFHRCPLLLASCFWHSWRVPFPLFQLGRVLSDLVLFSQGRVYGFSWPCKKFMGCAACSLFLSVFIAGFTPMTCLFTNVCFYFVLFCLKCLVVSSCIKCLCIDGRWRSTSLWQLFALLPISLGNMIFGTLDSCLFQCVSTWTLLVRFSFVHIFTHLLVGLGRARSFSGLVGV